jgi:type VI secretion system protein ImpL
MLRLVFAILTSRLLWGFIGITALAFIVWVIGPVVAIVDARPLEPEIHRLIAIGLLYLVWLIGNVVPKIYSAWLNGKLLGGMKSVDHDDPNQKRLTNEDQILADRFNEVSQLLKKARFNQGNGKKPGWAARFNHQYLYQLPWYVIIGAPGSGKTTALVNSGLNFPLADRFGKSALRGVGGTRNCDWWFTDDGVLLDTAGRYTTQESQRDQDAGEWLRFMQLLKKYRTRQPINGVIITLSVADLFNDDPHARQQQATALRKRLIELYEQLRIRFPVYVMVTKTDLMKGFMAYFADYDKTQREQIFGFTFPWNKEGNLSNDFDLENYLSQECHLLQNRLNAALADTLLRESNSQQRAEAYLFPQQFAVLQPLLAEALSSIFAVSGFETLCSPRGVFFTSGTQEGLTFDKVMGELTRSLAMPEGKVAAGGEEWNAVDRNNPIPANKGQSFFIKDLMDKVIFQESGLAGRNRWWELRNHALMITAYSGLVLGLVLFGGLWINSYANNQAYLQQVQQKVPDVERQGMALQYVGQGQLFPLLPFLNSLIQLPQSNDFSLASPPFSYRLGLYRGDEVSDASNTLYQKSLKKLLMPQVAQLITAQVRQDNGTDGDYSYEALKAYQMLYQPKHYDGKFLHEWVMLNLQRNLPANITQQQLQQMDWHLGQLLDEHIQSSPYARDDSLLMREQAFINNTPQAVRVYGRLKRLLAHADNLKVVSLITLAGPQAELVFSRRSGKAIADGVPGLYTPPGYWKRFDKQIDSVAKVLREDDQWVLNASAASQDREGLNAAVRQLYLGDYIRQWDAYLSDIQLNNVGSLTQRINSARLLSGNTSPLRNLVINLAYNLNLPASSPHLPAGVANKVEQKKEALEGSNANTLNALFSSPQAALQEQGASAEQVVSNHFAPIIQLAQPLDKDGKVISLDDFLKQLDELYSYLTAVQDAANSGMPAPGGDAIGRLQASAGRLPAPFQAMLSNLAVGASSDTQRRELDNVTKRVDVAIGTFCRQAIAGRYPLVAGARSEVTPDDLARMFAPGTGLMDSFFRDNLIGKVDTTQAHWRFMPGIDGKTLPGGESILHPFQQAQNIRDAFFANGANSPSFRATIRTVAMDNDILNLTLDIDGQLMHYSHGPQVTQVVSWPGSGGTNQVRLQLGLTNGSTSTLSTSGPWALNRFFDRAVQRDGGGNLTRQATFSVDGHHVTLEFTPNSIRNPFQLPGFSCP